MITEPSWAETMHRKILRRLLVVCAGLHWVAVLPMLVICRQFLLHIMEDSGARYSEAGNLLVHGPLWLLIATLISADLLWMRFHEMASRLAKVVTWLWVVLHVFMPAVVVRAVLDVMWTGGCTGVGR